jgi:peptidoglycan/LPS O-acetylase OafA/YrhL
VVMAGSVKLVEVLSIPHYTMQKYIVNPWGITGVFNIFENIATFVLIYALSDFVYSRGGWIKKYLSVYGLYSYGIYLAHILPAALSYSLLRVVIHSDNDIVILSNMLATIILSKVLVQWMTKLPLSKYYT